MNDRFDLQRFVDAQAPVYAQVLAELRAARKASHWMWFVFPQLVGLGSSPMARRYAISGLEEAGDYLAHPVLGPRLRECSGLVLQAAQPDVHRIFGSPDDLKFRSCMTLFQRAAREEPVFGACLDRYFGGQPDAKTIALL